MRHEFRPDTSLLVRERLNRNRDDTDALFTLAALEANQGRLDEGLQILDRVLVLDPRYPGGWTFKATLHRMRGEAEAARRASKRAEEMEP